MIICIFQEFSCDVTFPVFLFSTLIVILLCQSSLWFIFLSIFGIISKSWKVFTRQGAVYKLKCCDCRASYIGETGRNLSTRLTERTQTSDEEW